MIILVLGVVYEHFGPYIPGYSTDLMVFDSLVVLLMRRHIYCFGIIALRDDLAYLP